MMQIKFQVADEIINDGGSSTLTTTTTKNDPSTSNINDTNGECYCSTGQKTKKPLNLSCPSYAEMLSLYWLIRHDDIIGIRALISSLVKSSCTKNNSNDGVDYGILFDNNIQTIQRDIVNCILNDFGYTPIIVSVIFGHVDTARCLLEEYGADVNIDAYNGQTALHYAVQYPSIIESIELIKLLLRHTSNNKHHCLINRQDYNGNTPLHYASSEKVVRSLLQYDANIQIRNNYGEIPLHRAVKYTQYGVVKELLYYRSRSRSRHFISSDNNNYKCIEEHDDDDPKIDINYNKNNYYDYERIHCIKSNNDLTPYDTIIFCQSVVDIFDLRNNLRARLFHLFNQYEQEQQQLKRRIIYSYLLSLPVLTILRSK